MLVNIALKEVTKLTKNEITIGDIWLRPFSRLELSDIYVGDLRKDTLLYVKDLSVDFSLLPLLSGKLQVGSLSLNNFSANISADSVGGKLSYQFLVDAFSSDKVDTASTSKAFRINLENISLFNGKLSYNILSQLPASKGFDYNHIQIDSFRLDTDFNFTTVEDFIVNLKHLSFNEQSGFKLSKLAVNVSAASNHLQLSDFVLRLVKSELCIDSAFIDYSNTVIDSIAVNAKYSIPISRFVLYPTELAMFYPSLEGTKDSILLEAEVDGTLPAVNLSSFHLMYGKTLSIDASAYIDSYADWQSTPLELNISQLFFKPDKVNQLLQQLTGSVHTATVPLSSDYVSLKTYIKGTLPDLLASIKVNTASGDLKLDGAGGYVYSTGNAHIDAHLQAESVNIGHLLSNPMFGMVTLSSSVKASVSKGGGMSAILAANVSSFDFNGYSYHDIDADVVYAGDSIHLLAEVKDRNIPLDIKARGDRISTSNPYFYLEADARHILFDSLGFIPQYKGADLYAHIKAEVKGLDIERMEAKLSIDSLLFKTDKGEFAQDFMRLQVKNEQDGAKYMSLSAPIIDMVASGSFTFSTLPAAISNTLSKYVGAIIPYQEVEESTEELTLDVTLRSTEFLSQTLGLPFLIPDSVVIKARYYSDTINDIGLSVNTPSFVLGETRLGRTIFLADKDSLANELTVIAGTTLLQEKRDTLKLGMSAKILNDSIKLKLLLNDETESLALRGLIDANIYMQSVEGNSTPDIDVDLNTGSIAVNRQKFIIKPASLMMRENGYHINKFELDDSSGGFIKVDGIASASDKDTVKVSIGNLRLSTIMTALQSDIDLKGIASGDIKATKILEQPLVFTNNFGIDSIRLNNEAIGKLGIRSAWSNERQGIALGATLEQSDSITSQIRGYYLPKQDKLSMKADLNKLQLKWLQPMTKDYLFGLAGSLGLQLSAEGALMAPTLSGLLSFENANIGVKKTNVQYRISDTIHIKPDSVLFSNFQIYDNENNTALINGGVKYSSGFSSYNLNMNMRLRNLHVLDNLNQKDSMLYGKLGLNGTINVLGTSKGLVVKSSLSNSGSGKVFIQQPQSSATAQQYAGITYVSGKEDSCVHVVNTVDKIQEKEESTSTTFPLRAEVVLTLSPDLVAGMIFDPAAGDYASVSGGGNIQLIYDMEKDDMSLHGDYTIEKGNAAFAFQNVLKKQFQLAKGGKVTFKGDPLDTKFNATAIYSLKADLATLDESFSSDPYLSSTSVLVNCLINISGNADQMSITYNIQIPGVDESVQRKVEGLLYNEDLKIKQIAYLLARGRFYPPEGVVGGGSGSTTWISFLSSTLSSQLNSLLDNVLNENWTVGTELRTGEDGSTDNIEANVMVSANLFDNRVTVTTNLGYKNTVAANDFTGDFSVEYKVTKRGDWVLKAYNVTNDQFYEQAPTTQGVGVVYKREAKTFKELFKRRRRRTGSTEGARRTEVNSSTEKSENSSDL